MQSHCCLDVLQGRGGHCVYDMVYFVDNVMIYAMMLSSALATHHPTKYQIVGTRAVIFLQPPQLRGEDVVTEDVVLYPHIVHPHQLNHPPRLVDGGGFCEDAAAQFHERPGNAPHLPLHLRSLHATRPCPMLL